MPFNLVEIGRKLIDHLKAIAGPTVLEEAAVKPIAQVEKIQILVGIINLFHLLPAKANVFLEEIIATTLDLEKNVLRYRSSPFRPALIRFLNRYAQESIDFFYSKVSNSHPHNRLFVGVLGLPESEPIRLQIMNASETFVASTISSSDPESRKQGVLIMNAICAHHPDWLLSNTELVDRLLQLWREQILTCKSTGFNQNQTMIQAILDLFIIYCTKKGDVVDLLFDMVDALDLDVTVEQDGLKSFIYTQVCLRYGVSEKKAVLAKFFKLLPDPAVRDEKKALIIRMLIVPMLMAVPDDTFVQVFDHTSVECMDKLVWSPLSVERLDKIADTSKIIELLQLTSLILQRASSTLVDAKKHVIKFAWNYIKAEDITWKQATYVALARFVLAFETPPKIIMQIFVSLLRSHQPEVRSLVRQALDILLPILPDRVAPTTQEAATSQVSVWVRWTRRVIIEDGHTSSQLVSIFQLVIRHASLFYANRDSFIPQIVGNLVKLGLSSTTREQKGLTIELAELVYTWHKQEALEKPVEHVDKRRRISAQDDTFRDAIVTYLVKFLLSLTDGVLKKELESRTCKLLSDFLTTFPETGVKLSLLEKAYSVEVSEVGMSVIMPAVEILSTILNARSDAWIIENMAAVSTCIEKWVKSDMLGKELRPILERIFKAIRPTLQAPLPAVASFVKHIESVIKAGIMPPKPNPATSLFCLMQASC